MNWSDVDLDWAYGDLLGIIRRKTNSLDQSHDILHDALLRMALTRSREQLHQPKAYLLKVVHSVMADRDRDRRRWMPLPDQDDITTGKTHPDILNSRRIMDETHDPARDVPTPEFLAEMREKLRALQRITDALPSRCREVFWLFRVEGYTQPEIAVRLGITLKTVEYHISRAMLALLKASEI